MNSLPEAEYAHRVHEEAAGTTEQPQPRTVRVSPRDLPAVLAGVFLMIVMIWLWSVAP